MCAHAQVCVYANVFGCVQVCVFSPKFCTTFTCNNKHIVTSKYNFHFLFVHLSFNCLKYSIEKNIFFFPIFQCMRKLIIYYSFCICVHWLENIVWRTLGILMLCKRRERNINFLLQCYHHHHKKIASRVKSLYHTLKKAGIEEQTRKKEDDVKNMPSGQCTHYLQNASLLQNTLNLHNMAWHKGRLQRKP